MRRSCSRGLSPEKTDVFSAGRLLLSMLYPVAVHNVRLHRPLGFLDNTQTLTAGESVPSGLPQEMRAEVNRLLLRATARTRSSAFRWMRCWQRQRTGADGWNDKAGHRKARELF